MAVKRRVIWLRDDEWEQLTQYAKDNNETVSGVIRDFWKVAAEPEKRVAELDHFNSRPFTPVPKRRG